MNDKRLPSRFLLINVDTATIKICDVSMKKEVVYVYSAITIPTPEFSFEDGVLKDFPNVVRAINDALKLNGIKTKDVIFTISSSKVLTKEVTIPYIKSEQKILSLIASNANEYFPVSTEDCVYSYSVLEEFQVDVDGKMQKQMRIMAYAIMNDIVNSRFELANQLSLKVHSIDYSGNSIVQICKRQVSDVPSMTVLMNEDSTIISIFNKNSLLLQRTISTGRSVIVNAVSAAYNIGRAEASDLLERLSIKEIVAAKPIVGDAIEGYFTSVNRVAEYFKMRFSDISIQEACVFGAGSLLIDALDLYEKHLGLPVKKIDKLNNIEFVIDTKVNKNEKNKQGDKSDEGDTDSIETDTAILPTVIPDVELFKYVEVLGAAYSPLAFVSKELEGDYLARSLHKTYRLIILCALLVGVILVAIPAYDYIELKDDADKLKTDIERIEDVTPIINEYNIAYARYKDINELTFTSETSTQALLTFIESLELLKPSNLEIQTLNCPASGSISMSCVTDSKESVAKFIMQLKSISNVSDVWASGITEGISTDGTKLVSFGITCMLSHDYFVAE